MVGPEPAPRPFLAEPRSRAIQAFHESTLTRSLADFHDQGTGASSIRATFPVPRWTLVIPSPTPNISGRQVFVDLEIDGETHPILFDPWCREPWLTYEQAARILKISITAFRMLILRLRKNDIVSEDSLRKRMGVGRDGRRTTITYVSWTVIMCLSGPISFSRHRAVIACMGAIAMTMAEGTKLLPLYSLNDYVAPK